MSFVGHPMLMNGTPVDARPLRHCGRCERDRLPQGGVELGPGRWQCSQCCVRRGLLSAARQRRTQ